MPDLPHKECLNCGLSVALDVTQCPHCGDLFFRAVPAPTEPPSVSVSDWSATISADIAGARARSATLVSPEPLTEDSAPEVTDPSQQSGVIERRLLRLVMPVALGVAVIAVALVYFELHRRDNARASARATCDGLFATINDGSFEGARTALEQMLHVTNAEQHRMLADAIRVEVSGLVTRAKRLEASDLFLSGGTYRQAAYGSLLLAAIAPSEAERAGDGFVAAADLFLRSQNYALAADSYGEAIKAYTIALEALVGVNDAWLSRLREKHDTAVQDAALARALVGEGAL